MNSGTEFLDLVTDKLKQKLIQTEKEIAGGRKEIEKMNDYYWENYTEMDQYGYENYDNQQALLQQVNANQDKQKVYRRLKKMVDSPFFGRVDFCYDGEEEAESFYIGIANFSERAGSIPLIYDWRAPVSGLFYDFDSGPAYYDAPGGKMEGEILSKRQYKIRGGKILYEFESDIKIDDEILRQELGTSADVKLKNIVCTIQKEQNQIIRNTKDKILVIQGAAGSGKTSVALHRIAYLLYHDRNKLRSQDVLILSPNSVFSDYISHILPELGEEPVQEMSFDLFAWQELKQTVADCRDRYDFLESLWHAESAEEADRLIGECEYKQSRDMAGMMEVFLIELEDRLLRFRTVEFRGMELKEEEMVRLFYTKFQDIPLLSRMEAVIEYFIDSYETLYGRDLSEEDTQYIRSQFMSMYTSTDLYVIYCWFLEENGYPAYPDTPLERRILDFADVYPLLYLKYRLCRPTAHRNIRHLIIDEMQDYSYLQYVILERMFSCRMTILGDRAQTLGADLRDVTRFLPSILGKQIREIELTKSYRNTWEIAVYASKITGIDNLEFLERHGKPVEDCCMGTWPEASQNIIRQLFPQDEFYETAAVLTMTEEEARYVYACLKRERTDVNYIDRNSTAFRKGVTVTTYYLAKGLEFDQVFTLCRQEETLLSKQAEYVCATRALHELYMYRLPAKW